MDRTMNGCGFLVSFPGVTAMAKHWHLPFRGSLLFELAVLVFLMPWLGPPCGFAWTEGVFERFSSSVSICLVFVQSCRLASFLTMLYSARVSTVNTCQGLRPSSPQSTINHCVHDVYVRVYLHDTDFYGAHLLRERARAFHLPI